MQSDIELFRAWAEGDKQAGEGLVRRHFLAVYGFFHARFDTHVDDLIQRTFAAVLEAHHRFRPERGTFRAYLFGIARKEMLLQLRDARRRAERAALGHVPSQNQPTSPTVRIAKHDEQRLLLQALRRLPVDFQITIHLHYWEGMKGKEMACVLDVPEGTVWSRLTRAKHMLRAQIEAMSESAGLTRSTVDNLERWAESLKAALTPD
jgi:RNA polymerase sigma-70 factor (ECF subfamily)